QPKTTHLTTLPALSLPFSFGFPTHILSIAPSLTICTTLSSLCLCIPSSDYIRSRLIQWKLKCDVQWKKYIAEGKEERKKPKKEIQAIRDDDALESEACLHLPQDVSEPDFTESSLSDSNNQEGSSSDNQQIIQTLYTPSQIHGKYIFSQIPFCSINGTDEKVTKSYFIPDVCALKRVNPTGIAYHKPSNNVLISSTRGRTYVHPLSNLLNSPTSRYGNSVTQLRSSSFPTEELSPPPYRPFLLASPSFSSASYDSLEYSSTFSSFFRASHNLWEIRTTDISMQKDLHWHSGVLYDSDDHLPSSHSSLAKKPGPKQYHSYGTCCDRDVVCVYGNGGFYTVDIDVNKVTNWHLYDEQDIVDVCVINNNTIFCACSDGHVIVHDLRAPRPSHYSKLAPILTSCDCSTRVTSFSSKPTIACGTCDGCGILYDIVGCVSRPLAPLARIGSHSNIPKVSFVDSRTVVTAGKECGSLFLHSPINGAAYDSICLRNYIQTSAEVGCVTSDIGREWCIGGIGVCSLSAEDGMIGVVVTDGFVSEALTLTL
ncbi:hypothetical protein ADUPG1_009636, partial [Aduncisulcus paluster]